MPSYSLYIGGRWVESDTQEMFPAVNPYTQETWASIPQADEQQVADAIAAARRAFDNTGARRPATSGPGCCTGSRISWRTTATGWASSKPPITARSSARRATQMTFAARQYRFYAGYADKLSGHAIPLDQRDVLDYTVREPMGVVVLVAAWNSPMVLLSNKLAPALAAGNCVVIKPSEHASATTLEFRQAGREGRLPARRR